MRGLIAVLLVSAAVVHADTLTYDFDTGLIPSGTTDAIATNVFYTLGNNSENNSAATAQLAWYDQDATNNFVYWLSGRLSDNKAGISPPFTNLEPSLNMAAGNPSYVSFPIEVALTNQLDFTGATLQLEANQYNDALADFGVGYQIWGKKTGGAWQALSGIETNYMPSVTNLSGIGTLFNTNGIDGVVNDNTTPGTVDSLTTNFTFDISALGAMVQGQGVEIAVAVTGTRDNHGNFSSSIDDVVISNFTVTEAAGVPSYSGILYLGDGVDSFTNSPATWDTASADWGVFFIPNLTPWTNWIDGATVNIEGHGTSPRTVELDTNLNVVVNVLSWNGHEALSLVGVSNSTETITITNLLTTTDSRQITIKDATLAGQFSVSGLSRLQFDGQADVAPGTVLTVDASDIQLFGTESDFTDLSLSTDGSVIRTRNVSKTLGSLSGFGQLGINSNVTLTVNALAIGETNTVAAFTSENSSDGGDFVLGGGGTNTFTINPNNSDADLLSIGPGELTFGGVLEIVATSTNKLGPGNVFKLFDAGSYAGAFTDVILPTDNLEAGAIFFDDLAVDGTISVGTPGVKYSVIRFDKFLNESTWVPGTDTMFGSITNANGTIFTLTATVANPLGGAYLHSNVAEYLQGITGVSSSNNVVYRFDSGNHGDPNDDEQVQLTLAVNGTPVDSLSFGAVDTRFAAEDAPVEIIDRFGASITIHSNVNTITESDLPGLETLTKNNVSSWSLDMVSRERPGPAVGQWSIDYVEFVATYFIGGSPYNAWASTWGVDIGGENDDYEGDGLENLYEYGVGGNPTNDDAAAVLPTGSLDSGWLYLVHNERTGDPSLTFTVQRKNDLVSDPSWLTDNIDPVGESDVVNNFKSVTNRTDAASSEEFLRLEIKKD